MLIVTHAINVEILEEFLYKMNEKIEQLNSVLKHPCSLIIAGPSKCGKTTLIQKFLEHNATVFDLPPQKIYYCYSRLQDIFDDLKSVKPSIQFIKGLPKIDLFSKYIRNLLVLDDLMSECGNDETIKNIFTVDSHHQNISVFLLSQNLFSTDKYFRSISIIANYMIILNNPRDRSQFTYLARQIDPGNTSFLNECYYDAVDSKEYGYLFLDFTQTTNKILRVQSDFCFDDPNSIKRVIYLPKE